MIRYVFGITLLVLCALACLGAVLGGPEIGSARTITGALLLCGFPGVLFLYGRMATRIYVSGIVLLVLCALACLGAVLGVTEIDSTKVVTGALLLLGAPGVVLFRFGRRATRNDKG